MAPRVMWAVFTVAVLLVCGAVGAVGAEGADARMDPSPTSPVCEAPLFEFLGDAYGHGHTSSAESLVFAGLEHEARQANARQATRPPRTPPRDVLSVESNSNECEGTVIVHELSGRIGSNIGTNFIPQDTFCMWIFQMPELAFDDNNCMVMTFEQFNLDAFDSFLMRDSRGLLPHTGLHASVLPTPFRIVAHGTTTVELFTDVDSWGDGFEFTYEITDVCEVSDVLSPVCDPVREIDEPSGSVSIDAELQGFGDDLFECTWHLLPPEDGQCLTVTLTQIWVPFLDEVTVFSITADGEKTTELTLSHVNQPVAVGSSGTGAALEVHLSSQLWSGETVRLNFSWERSECLSVPPLCSGRKVVTDRSGQITVPRYVSDIQCEWEFRPTRVHGSECLVFTIEELDLDVGDRLEFFTHEPSRDAEAVASFGSVHSVHPPINISTWHHEAIVVLTSDILLSGGRMTWSYRMGACGVAPQTCSMHTSCLKCAQQVHCAWCAPSRNLTSEVHGHCVQKSHECSAGEPVRTASLGECPNVRITREALTGWFGVINDLHTVPWPHPPATVTPYEWCGITEPRWEGIRCDIKLQLISLTIYSMFDVMLKTHRNCTIPRATFELTTLKTLEITLVAIGCNLGDIPPTLGHLTRLRRLTVDIDLPPSRFPWEALRGLHDLRSLTLVFPAEEEDAPTSDMFDWSVLDGMPLLHEMQLSLVGRCPFSASVFEHHPQLVVLSISNCDMTPYEWEGLAAHTQLEVLALGITHMRSFPKAFPPTLQFFHFTSRVSASGEIPAEWFTGDLRHVAVQWCNITGTLPRAMSNSTLETLRIVENRGRIAGTLPPLPPSLYDIELSGNALEGTIPPGYFNINRLLLSHNELTGTIPPERGERVCWVLAHNRLSGTVPPWVLDVRAMVQCTYGTELDLSHNDFHGEVAGCERVHRRNMPPFIDLSHNRFVGQLPDFSCCLSTPIVRVAGNSFSGTIPEGLMFELSEFDLSDNQMSGTIPEPSSRMHTFLAANNALTGKIPRRLFVNAAQRFTNSLWAGTNTNVLVNLNNNPLGSDFPNLIEYPHDLVFSADLRDVRASFDCRNCSLTGKLSMPALMAFTHVDFSDNMLTGLSNGGAMDAVPFDPITKSMRLSNNQMTTALTAADMARIVNPATFPRMETLDLAHNMLSEFDARSLHLVLTDLRLNDQKGTGLQRLLGLEFVHSPLTLDISHNALRELYLGSAVWMHLTWLRAHANPLEALEMRGTKLTSISLSHTNVTGPLPDALFTNDKLRLADLRSSAFAIPYEPACDVDLNACLPRGLRRGELSPSADPSYSCYLPQHDAAIRFEWNTYFAHANCRCAEGFFGRRAVCHACVDGAMCPGGDAQMTMHAEAGFWGPVVDLGADTVHVSHDAVVVPDVCDGTSAMYRQCAPLHRHACATAGSGGVSSDASWQSCGGDGAYHGRMCSMCTADHFALGDECLACPSDGVVALLVLFSVAVLLGIVARALRTRHKRERAGTLSIALFYVQMIALLAWVGVPLSAPLSRLALLAAPFNLELPGWECVSAAYSFRGQFWMSVFTLPVLGVLVGGVAWLAARRGVRSASHTAVHVMTMLVLAKYMSASARVLRALGVEDGGCGVGTFFVHAPAVAADTPASRAVIGMAWMLLVVLVLGVPAWLVWVLRRKHGRQGAEHVTASSRQRYGGLFECYASRWWFWEAVVTLRKLLIAMVLGVSAYGSSMASFGVFVVLLLSAVLQRAVQPFADPLDNVLEYGSLAVLSANFALAMVFFSEDAAEGTRGLITAVLVLLNALMLVSFVFALARRRRAALLVAGRVKGSGRSRRHIGAQASLASMRSMASMREGALAAVAASDAAQGAGSSGGGSGGGGGGVRSSARAHQSPLLTNMFH